METDDWPQPAKHLDHLSFWEGTHAGRLLVQRCVECATPRWPPRPMCVTCMSGQSKWVDAPLTGTLFSWTTVHHTSLSGYKKMLPYSVGLVELTMTGGRIRMMGRLVNCAPDTLLINQTVQAEFHPVQDSTLVLWSANASEQE